ncbi:N-Acetyl-D-glucosamine ABC transport system, permease protein 1 [Labilithrix luteola]|uniref:N-Acetyl-D-glucosamine ABC transport system, permease protein 1 n=1 Tax=Labilithrix luteola TaxID=1391654 RepID=A0A0K1Q899_9BACT|nr:sugar ABC transporter permease [Labilithrix luteola]AKV01954.1 N-Acetyl-D-glucosamine ABC transport system, permease protein 1 [Labilithrix luteola]
MMRPRARSHPWLMLAPSLGVWALFVFLPLGLAGYESLFSWDMLTEPTYVGGANYAALSGDGELLRILVRTLGFSALVVTGSMSLGLALALLLDRPGRLFGFVRGAIFSAYVVSWVAVALLWVLLLDPDSGIFAALLRAVGLPRIGFLTDPHTALVTLAGVTVWKITGYSLVVFLAGLRAVPKALHEAASLDGAGRFDRFRYVTWPVLKPTAAFVATTSLIVSFQAFDVVRIMTQGGPARATTLFVYAIYEQIFMNLSVGRASALAVVYFGVLAMLALLQLRAWRSQREEGGRA